MDGMVGFGSDTVVWLLAIAGAGFGVLGCIFGVTSRWRYQGLQRRVLEIEEARRSERVRRARQARLHAFLEEQVEMKWYLTIQNQGPAEAKNLTASINGSPLDNCPLVDPNECDLDGLGSIGAHRGVRIPLHTDDRPAELQLELTWSDDSGQLGFYQAILPVDRSLSRPSEPHPALAHEPDRDR